MAINVLSHGLVYSSCSVTKRLSVHVPRKKLELINDHRDFITYFSRHFQFQDLRRMNKDYESAEWDNYRNNNIHLSYMDFRAILRTYFVDIWRLVKSAKEFSAQIEDHGHCKHGRANVWHIFNRMHIKYFTWTQLPWVQRLSLERKEFFFL